MANSNSWATVWTSESSLCFLLMWLSKTHRPPESGSLSKWRAIIKREVLLTMLIYTFLFLKMLKVRISAHPQATPTMFLRTMLWNGHWSSSLVTSKDVNIVREYVLSADFKLPTIESPKRNAYKKQPINIQFEIPFFTVSGFQVRYLKIVDRSGYKASPWVKYLTKNGEYQIRMNWFENTYHS